MEADGFPEPPSWTLPLSHTHKYTYMEFMNGWGKALENLNIEQYTLYCAFHPSTLHISMCRTYTNISPRVCVLGETIV